MFPNYRLKTEGLKNLNRLLSHGNPPYPDLTIASPHIAIDSEWRTLMTINSAHLPMFFKPLQYAACGAPHRKTTPIRRIAVRETGAASWDQNEGPPENFRGLTSHHAPPQKHWPLGLQYLNRLYNISLNHCNIPAMLEHATIIPTLTPDNLADLGTGYRSISHQFTAVKVLARLLHPKLN